MGRFLEPISRAFILIRCWEGDTTATVPLYHNTFMKWLFSNVFLPAACPLYDDNACATTQVIKIDVDGEFRVDSLRGNAAQICV